jgi:glutamate synthase (NADPH/NADH) large chain
VLISAGCIMMRKCHLNTCPVGVATQDPELRKRFTGLPEHVVNFMMFIAAEVREIMAQLGFRTFSEMIGRADRLEMRAAIEQWKARGLDFSRIFFQPPAPPSVARFNSERQDHGIDAVLDRQLIEQAREAIEHGTPVRIDVPVRNTNRIIGGMLSGVIARRHGHEGLADGTIHVRCTGTAGQTFGGFLARGVTLELEGDANDYVGKGLSGGRVIVYPSAKARFEPTENIVVGNTVLYGAIAGEAYFRGVAGERFAVRNSGALAVVEGVGDHGCEYMTGGCVVVLGETGRNFAAGMSGGVAYVLDITGQFERRCNLSMVALEPIADEDDQLEALYHQGGDLESHGLVEIMRDMTRFDAQRLKAVIAAHHRYTSSRRAAEVLDRWTDFLPRFVKVMPVDYRRALEQMQARWRPTERRGVSIAVGA